MLHMVRNLEIGPSPYRAHQLKLSLLMNTASSLRPPMKHTPQISGKSVFPKLIGIPSKYDYDHNLRRFLLLLFWQWLFLIQPKVLHKQFTPHLQFFDCWEYRCCISILGMLLSFSAFKLQLVIPGKTKFSHKAGQNKTKTCN